MSHYIALVVDDEPDIRELLELTLSRMDILTQSAANLDEARKALACQQFDLCLTDMKLPDGNGIELVEHIQEQHPEVPVAMITAHGNMEAAISALKAGAFDFVSKPVDLNVLRKLVSTAIKVSEQKENVLDRRSRDTLLGNAQVMRQIRGKIVKLARSQAPVYISGPSGSGKELVAKLIHEKSPRSENPFIPVNCGAIPEQLMESEFFGHKKGTFTGATSDKPGLFQAANGGTLFLDEVADLPLHMQVKLLRAIQEKTIRPLGEQKEFPVDVRIVSATHKDLAKLVDEGEFRQDLFYRINVIELKVPSLSERRIDIPLLAEHFLTKISTATGVTTAQLTPAALEALEKYPFPGNVRELENILERATTLCEDDLIQVDDLQLPGHEKSQAATADDESGLTNYLDDKEREAIQKALEETRYNKTAAAKLLGLSFRQLRYRLKKLGID